MNRTVMDDNNRDSKCDNAREQTYQLQNKPKRSRKNKLYNDTQIVERVLKSCMSKQDYNNLTKERTHKKLYLLYDATNYLKKNYIKKQKKQKKKLKKFERSEETSERLELLDICVIIQRKLNKTKIETDHKREERELRIYQQLFLCEWLYEREQTSRKEGKQLTVYSEEDLEDAKIYIDDRIRAKREEIELRSTLQADIGIYLNSYETALHMHLNNIVESKI